MGRGRPKKVAKPASDDEGNVSEEDIAVAEDIDNEENNIDYSKNKGVSPKFLIVPEEIQDAGWDSFEFVKLKHPRTGNPALFLIDIRNDDDSNGKARQYVYEILTFEQSTRSWFVGDTVASDGNLHIVTPFDPIFLVSPIFAQNGNAQPLEDHLFEKLPANVLKAVLNGLKGRDVAAAFAKKEVGDITAYKYDEGKMLGWLEKKVKIVSSHFEKRDITRMESSISSNFSASSTATNSKDPKEYLIYACDVIGENIPSDLKKKLQEHLGLPTDQDRKRKTDDASNGNSNKKVKVDDDGEVAVVPLEDYSGEVSGNGAAAVTPKTFKAKQLLKAAAGSQSLFKFFGAKK